MSKYPKINYIGNKDKLVDWIIENLPIKKGVVLDLFSGGNSVAYALKENNYTVYSNDALYSNYVISKAIIENKDVTVNEDILNTKVTNSEVNKKYKEISFLSNRLYYDDEVKEFLLNEEKSSPLGNITILAGLAVNTSPALDYMFGNMKLRWGDSPLLLANSIVTNIDYNTGHITLREERKIQEFENYALSYVFRFNSLQLLILCWDRDIKEDVLNKNNIILKYQYPYSILDASGNTVLSRCTSEATYHHEQLIDVTWGQGLMDEISYMRGTFSEQSEKYFEEVQKRWDEEERKLAEEHPR